MVRRAEVAQSGEPDVVITAQPPLTSPPSFTNGENWVNAWVYKKSFNSTCSNFIPAELKQEANLNIPYSSIATLELLYTLAYHKPTTIIMTDTTFHVTRDELRKPESQIAGKHHGKTPADSEVSGLKVCQVVFRS